MSRWLRGLCAPRDEQARALYYHLCTVARRHYHGMHDSALFFLCLLCAGAAAFQPLRIFSFYVWFAIMLFYLGLPAALFGFENVRKGRAAELYATPLRSAQYASAFAAFFRLTAVFAAVPYVVFWILLLAERSSGALNTMIGVSMGRVILSALSAYVAVAGLMWLTFWSIVFGGAFVSLPLIGAAVLIGALNLLNTSVLLITVPLSNRGFSCGAALFMIGEALHVIAGGNYRERALAQLFG